MTPERAETVAILVLGWLAGEDEILPVFIGSTGLAADDLGGRASDPDLLLSVLDFVLLDDAWVIACTDALGLRRDEPFAAHAILSGASRMHWT